jgi:hypothetical protein
MGISSLWKDSFTECLNLKSIVFLESVTHIEKCLFYEYKMPVNITFPQSICSIGVDDFSNFLELRKVMFF